MGWRWLKLNDIYLSLLDKIELIVDEAGLRDKEIIIRMSGCPNGCSRPALGEIGFIGKRLVNTICI